MNDHSIFSFHGNLQVSSPGEPKRFYFCSSNPLRYQGRTQPRYQQRLVVGTPEAGDQKPQRARKRIQTRLFVFLQVNFISVSSTILPLWRFSPESFQGFPLPFFLALEVSSWAYRASSGRVLTRSQSLLYVHQHLLSWASPLVTPHRRLPRLVHTPSAGQATVRAGHSASFSSFFPGFLSFLPKHVLLLKLEGKVIKILLFKCIFSIAECCFSVLKVYFWGGKRAGFRISSR